MSTKEPKEPMIGPLTRIPGLLDANLNEVRTEQKVRFTYRRTDNWEDAEPTTYQGEGVIRLSPYIGAYIVHEGRIHRVHKHRHFEVIS